MTDTAPVANIATDAEVMARRFPLVPRPHPPCPPIDVRIAEVITLARAAGRGDDKALGRTAAAHNNAALIASDCGLPDLARTLCWQHHDRYPRTRSWSAQEARYALEPLVNLARLHLRAGNTDAGLHLLNSLYDAVRLGVETEIDGRPLDFRNLTTSSDDHHTLCRWLWTVVLADGLRALTRAGRWEHALAHAQHHNGIGRRLLDGRQIAVLTSALRGDCSSATNLLDESVLHESWERAVAACLHVITCRHTRQPLRSAVPGMIDRYLALQPSHRGLVFHVRLGLTVIDLAGGPTHPDSARVATHVIHHATSNIDGYAARELLAHDTQERLSHNDREALLAARKESSINCNPDPNLLTTTLLNALEGRENSMSWARYTPVP